MRSKDIEVGKVYGYREGKSAYDHTYQVKFLAPLADLYTYKDRTHRIERAFVKKPQARSIYPADGYLVAIGNDVSTATLESALETGVSWGHSEVFDYRILTNMAAVIGPDFETANAAQEAAREARSARWEAEDARSQAKSARSQAFVDRLAAHGVKAWKGDHGGVEIWGDEADKLLELLDNPPHQIIIDSLSGVQEELTRQALDAAAHCSDCTPSCTLWPKCRAN